MDLTAKKNVKHFLIEFTVKTLFEITLITEIHKQRRKFFENNVFSNVFYINCPFLIDVFRGAWPKFFMSMNILMHSVWFICSEFFFSFPKRKICTRHSNNRPYTKHNC